MEKQSDVIISTTTSLSADEIIMVVDEQNNIIGKDTRRNVRLNNLWHRASYIFVYKKESNQILVQKRSMKKDYCPGYFDVANGGVVGADETDELNASRELREEIGLIRSPEEMQVLKRIKFEDPKNRVWGNIFGVELHSDFDIKNMKLQVDEVDYVELWSVEDTLRKIQDGSEKITPDGALAFLEFLKLGLLSQNE